MGDKKKTTAIVLSSILVGVPAIAGITIGIIALTKNRKETPLTVQSIKIVNDINPISIEQGQTFTTEKVVVKCYDQNKSEMVCETKLSLLDNSKQPISISWISINSNNQILINSDAEVGNYKFLLQASTIDGKIVSECKTINLIINEKPTPPQPGKFDKITIEVSESVDMFENSTKKIKFTCKAWSQEEEYEGEIGDINWDFTISDASITELTPPLITYTSDKKVAEVTVTSAGDVGPVGSYNLCCNAYLKEKPEFKADAKTKVNVINSLTYTDPVNDYVYKRADANSTWTLTEIPSKTQILDGIREEILGYSVSTIDSELASHCSSMLSLTKVVLPKTIKLIKDNAFSYCTSLKTIEMEGVEEIENDAFNYCQMMHITVQPTNLKTIGDSAFYNSRDLDEINLKSASKIGSNAFYRCRIASIELSADLEIMHASNFSNCSLLETVTIHAKTPPVCEGKIFTSCSNLKTIYVPSESLSDYQNTEYWSVLKDIMKPIE